MRRVAERSGHTEQERVGGRVFVEVGRRLVTVRARTDHEREGEERGRGYLHRVGSLLPRRHAGRSIVALSAVAVLFVSGAWLASACSSEGDRTAPLDAGADVVDEFTQVGACTLSGDVCVGRPVCCRPFPGRMVDLDAGCKARTETQIACLTPGSCRGLTMGGLVTCYRRSNDDGSTTTFYAAYRYPRTPPNVVPCDQDEATGVTDYPDCP